MIKPNKLFLWPLLLILLSCQPSTPRYQQSILVFGTVVDITLADVTPEQAASLFQMIEARLQTMHQAWHAWQPSTVTAINQACQQNQVISVDQDVAHLLSLATLFYQESQGLFNPAAGQLIELWGFYSDEPTISRQPPSPAAIQHILHQHPSMEDIDIDQEQVHCKNSYIKLDFGGFAKGYALEQIALFLQHAGIQHAMINAGGDLRALGRYGNRPWRVAIAHPTGSATPLGYLDVYDGESVLSSGTYLRRFTFADQTYHHILDPRTGYPAQGFVATTVLHQDSARADAAATALLIAGPLAWEEIAKKMEIAYALMVTAQGDIIMTPAMQKRFSSSS